MLLLIRRRCDYRLPSGEVKAAHLAFDERHADRIEDVAQRHAGRRQVGFVIAHADGMKRIAIDESYCDLFIADSQFVELARRSRSGPQPREAAAEH